MRRDKNFTLSRFNNNRLIFISMTFYPPKINARFAAPRNAGEAENANAVGAGAIFVCGAVLKFYLRIDEESKRIVEAKFKTDGCGFSIAAADVLTETIKGKKLSELHGLENKILEEKLESELEKFNANRRHCLNLSLETLRKVFADFRAAKVREFAGEKALICSCFGVSEETIENLIKEKSLVSVEEIIENCGAGGGCGSCQPLIQELIDVYWAEN